MSQGKAELEFIKSRNKDIQGTTNHAWEYRCGFLEEDSHFNSPSRDCGRFWKTLKFHHSVGFWVGFLLSHSE